MRDNIDEIPSGGIGIQLISKIADRLSYTRTSDYRNCLLIVKYFQPGLIPPQPSPQSGYLKRVIDFLNGFIFPLERQRNRQLYRSDNQPIKTIHLQLNTDLKSVAQVLWWVEQFFLEYLPIPEAVLQQCKLATIEGFTNAVRHAHKNLPLETPIDLEITVFNERLELKIWDMGEPFDLQAKLIEELPVIWSELGFMLD
ncbi:MULTISPECIES: ATP-binding protein [unclassified Microcoleus]|uniref:ATP-binding protein n=1 Tax=unclassified Microcoleus TaxID=2642155 RepID=UPI002FCF2E2B